MKPELIQQEHGVKSTVVIFGGSRIPDPATAAKRLQAEEMQAKREPLSEMAAQRVRCAQRVLDKSNYYEEARELAKLITEGCASDAACDLIVSTVRLPVALSKMAYSDQTPGFGAKTPNSLGTANDCSPSAAET